jgi:octaheme c-type cytochrome (tetrathionate reductase family)
MRDFKYIWVVGLLVTLGIIIVPIVSVTVRQAQPSPDPWDYVVENPPATDHSTLLTGPFETGSDVTRACLECHEDAATEVMASPHFTWLSEPVTLENREEPVRIGKANTINNFCIGIQGNEQGCTRCHAGYGWEDETFFQTATEANVDCLVCHDTSGLYAKGTAGQPLEEVDLVAVAQSVGYTSRQTCGGCHFNGGGGNAVKHGDLDETLFYPTEDIDIHMGRYDFQCSDCHQTTNHQISGHSISVSATAANPLACTDCHTTDLHSDERITAHVETVACQTCHIPEGAVRDATKTHWDWSQVGDDTREEDPHVYLKIKGEFVYEADIVPEYYWFNGDADRYLLGDTINTEGPTDINTPLGSIDDPTAKIWPFKVHRAIQPFDEVYAILLQPKTVGEGGLWSTFDWPSALEAGAQEAGIPFSGEYGFTETEMYWPLSHMVVPGEEALQCFDCHGEDGRMGWEALGYSGDPMYWGGRDAGGTP